MVRRPVYDEAMKIEDEVKAGAPTAFEEARAKVHGFQAAGDTAGAARWEEIFQVSDVARVRRRGTGNRPHPEDGETYDYKEDDQAW